MIYEYDFTLGVIHPVVYPLGFGAEPLSNTKIIRNSSHIITSKGLPVV